MTGNLTISDLVVTPIMQNCRILADKSGGDAVVIDPGGDCDKILARLEKLKLKTKEIWLTHSHLDHCGGVKGLKAATGAKVYGHPVEAMMRSRVEDIAKMYGILEGMENCPEPDVFIGGGETLKFGRFSFDVLFVPGHSPGHVCFYEKAERVLLAGDTLFAGSIGRTDLPGGDSDTLLKNIREKLLCLPDETIVMPGHGPNTTILDEKETNPFVQFF